MKRWHLAPIADGMLPFALAAAGLFHARPGVWYACIVFAFVVLAAPVLGGAWLVTTIVERRGERIQGPRRKPPLIAREAFETSRALFVAATLAAWPLAEWRIGRPTALEWDLVSWETVVAMLLGVIVMDAWLYWKHRLLHTRWLFPFHAAHHHFRDPTAFAAFAVAPFEAVLTFWPILLLCVPAATHWAPLYFAMVVGFVLLNFYLHCGVTFRWAEATLPRIGLNTSAFHNVHHSNVNANFGEAMLVWDALMKTRLSDRVQ